MEHCGLTHIKSAAMSKMTEDYDEIVRVMHLYMDAFGKNNVGMLREAFDEDAWIFYIDARGQLRKQLISNAFENWATSPDRAFVGRIVSVTQVGDVASVQLSLESETNSKDTWIDFQSLLRVNGVWKITNKTAIHAGRM